ncbi:MAG: alpha-E domain-containing protein, partial [Planctomycetota bacterium]
QFYDRVATFSMLFQGLCDHTLPRDQRWQFTQLAKWFERVDVTCRVLESRFEAPSVAARINDAPLRNIHWMAVLRMCCALEPFRRVQSGELDPLKIGTYLILDARFPRSIVFGVASAAEAVKEIRMATRRRDADAERILGRLHAHLKFARTAELIDVGLPIYLADIRDRVKEAAISISQAYFLR